MTTTPDLLYSDVEEQLRQSVRSLLDGRSDTATVLKRTESDEPYDPALWRTLGQELGVAALAVPEDRGGAGASWREVAVVAEEMGRAVAPVPFLGSAVVATHLLLATGDDLVAELAGGTGTVAVAVPFSTAPGDRFAQTVTADGETLSGRVHVVADARTADRFIVPAIDGDEPSLWLVDAGDVQIEPLVSMDLTRPVAALTLDGARGRRIATGDQAVAALDGALTAGAAILASEQLGLADRCLEMTIDYLKTRYQFGRPVGSFQALKHRLADLWVAITQARAAARYAAGCLAAGDGDTDIAVSVAQAHCSAVAVRAAEECVQMHGGIGFTWEHPAHLYLKRAKTTAVAFGTADAHRARLAALADLPPA